LREELEDAREQQYLILKRLEETEIDRDRLLAELEEQDKQVPTYSTFETSFVKFVCHLLDFVLFWSALRLNV